MAKSVSRIIIEVSNLDYSKPSQFNRKKGDNYIICKMKFKADQVMKGLYKAFQPNFKQELPSNNKAKLDLTDEAKKKQHKAVKKNPKAMMHLALSFSNVSLLNKLNCKKKKDKKWLTGKAHHVMTALIKEYEPENTMAKMEMEQALSKMILGSKKDPNKLLNKLALIECRYLLELSKSKKKAEVLRLGGEQYSSIIPTTSMIYRNNKATLTTKQLLEKMHIQWHLAEGKPREDKYSDNKDGLALVASTKKGGKKSGGGDKP
jgi:hypothetical protein